jgi:hypothetical protein
MTAAKIPESANTSGTCTKIARASRIRKEYILSLHDDTLLYLLEKCGFGFQILACEKF